MTDEPTFSYRVAGNAHVAVHGTTPPTDEEWQTYLDDVGVHVDRVRGVLVNTEGAGPSSRQRRMAAAHWKARGGGPRMAIMTASTVVRAMATALNWVLDNNLRAFAIDDYDEAAKYLGLSARDVTRIRVTVDQLRSELGLNS